MHATRNDWPRKRNGRRRRASVPGILKRRRYTRPVSWLLRLFLLAVIAVPSLVVASPGYVAFANRLPDADAVAQPMAQDTIIYASDGKTVLADLHPPGYQNYYEPLDQMGSLLPNALIAIEDRNFYSESGIDPSGVVRASLVDWHAGQTVEGASTITQQLVKIRLVGNELSIDRKLREALLAFDVERHYTKQQILEMYLNSVFFGNSAWGSAAAAKIYFHKATKDLDLAQASMLAGLVRGPTIYNPLIDWKSAKARQLVVLQAMVRSDFATQAEADAAYTEDISPPKNMFTPTNAILAPGFVSYVTSQLIAQFGTDLTYSGGLQVVTTLNYKLQTIAQTAVTNTLRSIAWRNVTQGALVSIDPTSGAILAMVGSANPRASGGQYNLAVWPPRNPGSSMKIFTYTAAIASKKYTMTTPIRDARFNFYGYKPQNYDGKTHGTCQLQACMGNSLNIPAVKVELGVGVAGVVQMARTMGAPPYQLHYDAHGNPIYTTNNALNTYGPSLTLGGYGETPLQMATGASVLATQGILRAPFAIASVSQRGASIFKHQGVDKRVLDARVAWIMQSIMSNDNNRAMIFGRGSILTLPGRKIAVKTGTSDSFADAWTIGFTPHLVTAVWVGNADWRNKMTKGSDSFFTAAPVFHNYMQRALDAMHMNNEWYRQPSGLITRWVRGGPAYYLPGTVGR
jgi:penicillin-binding protein 1A